MSKSVPPDERCPESMMPHEVAMKFASASAKCGNGRCPYTSECKGTTETCKMKEVAMMIRSLVAENETLKAKCMLMEVVTQSVNQYIKDLEKVNEYYYRLCIAFQNSYRPKPKIVKKSARKMHRRKKLDPVKMDGDERYAYDEPKEKTDLPVVII